MSDSLSIRIENMLASARCRIIIVSAFIRSETLTFLLSRVKPSVDISIYARWRIADLASGASDSAVIDVANRLNADFKVHDALHAKIYIADDKALVGSANATGSGLGMREYSANLEILIESLADCEEIQKVLQILDQTAQKPCRFSDDMLQRIQKSPMFLPEADVINAEDNWLPSSMPESVLRFCRGEEVPENSTIEDCCVLGIGIGTHKMRLVEITKSRRVFAVLKDAMSRNYNDALSDEKIITILSEQFFVKGDVRQKWEILKNWIHVISDDMYIAPANNSGTELRFGQWLNKPK